MHEKLISQKIMLKKNLLEKDICIHRFEKCTGELEWNHDKTTPSLYIFVIMSYCEYFIQRWNVFRPSSGHLNKLINLFAFSTTKTKLSFQNHFVQTLARPLWHLKVLHFVLNVFKSSHDSIFITFRW